MTRSASQPSRVIELGTRSSEEPGSAIVALIVAGAINAAATLVKELCVGCKQAKWIGIISCHSSPR